jgi:predicted metal-binding membrane protein
MSVASALAKTVADVKSAALIRSLPLKDRIIILSIIGIVTLLCWVYLITMAIDMDNMMAAGQMMQIPVWTVSYFTAMLLMWVVMMVGMMAPTAIPMALVYAAISRKAAKQGSTLAPTSTFVSGYIVMWTVFSLAATLAQWGLDEAALLSPMMVSNSPWLGATLLILAGLFQFTPMKNSCLRHCRAPAYFISEHWKPGSLGAFRMGVEHGIYCIGCCWILMGLLFFGGVMSLLWIAGITLFVLLEKVVPLGDLGGRIAGGAMALCGVIMLILCLRV